MHLVQPESNGPQAEVSRDNKSKDFVYKSSTLPFGQDVSLSSIAGPTYLTAQTLIQQVAYTLSDKVFAYSPETFDLDISLKQWQKEQANNAYGYATGVTSLETRAGAGSIALGYMFSKDFDLEKRHIPQTIVASSATLQQLRSSFDQLSLLYSVANPVVSHIAAVDYTSSGLVTDYVSAMTVAEELGLGMISSTSSYEVQHMSLFATLLATIVPSVHIYDGINIGRETTRVVDVLDQAGLHNAYQAISKSVSSSEQKHSDSEGKASRLLGAFNEELGTDYKLFEYYGHAEPETVLVVFGSVEGSLAAQLAFALSKNGAKVGAVNVRVYRPFVEEEFLEALPKSVKTISVLGQVKDRSAVADAAEQSRLYSDVLAAVAFSTRFTSAPTVVDVKYGREEVWTPSKMLSVLQNLKGADKEIMASQDRPNLDVLGPSVKQYSFWDVDFSTSKNTPIAIGKYLSSDSSENLAIRTGHDNLAQGGVVRSDIRISAKSIEAPYSSTSSSIAFVGDEKVLLGFNVLSSLETEGAIILKLPGAKEQKPEVFEKRLPEQFRREIVEKQVQLFILDPSASSKVAENASLETYLSQVAFTRLAQGGETFNAQKLASVNGDVELIQSLSADLETALYRFEVPESWAAIESQASKLPADLTLNSFVPFDREETEQEYFLKSWITAAKGLAFKEATGTRTALRPDLSTKTHIVTVKERRRLTPKTYDRNIFHIEFDLGDSGLTYAIGEALGIHADNDVVEVEAFIKWYGLEADAVVEVPSRDDPRVLENRTVYQALMQNIDIFGRPPKRFYEALAEFADDEKERKDLLSLSGPLGAGEFKRRAEVDTITYADILLEFPSAHPPFHEIARLVSPLKRREYSIASSQHVTPTSVSLLIVTVAWVDPQGRDRFGSATRYLNSLRVGSPVTVSVKPSVMKLPAKTTAPLIMAGLGTGLAPFRAFVQERAWQRAQGHEIGEVLLYMGSRHQREEYLYGEEWEAYRDAGVITLMGCAFSRDQAEKIYIQDRMRESLSEIRKAYLRDEGCFYLCGPTWPVADVTEVLEDAIRVEAEAKGEKKEARKEIEKLKDEARYVLEVY